MYKHRSSCLERMHQYEKDIFFPLRATIFTCLELVAHGESLKDISKQLQCNDETSAACTFMACRAWSPCPNDLWHAGHGVLAPSENCSSWMSSRDRIQLFRTQVMQTAMFQQPVHPVAVLHRLVFSKDPGCARAAGAFCY